jgi:ABC-2 type transport system ATP-binding protein
LYDARRLASEGVAGVAAITVQGLRKSYGDFEAVKGVSFEVAEGEVFTLLGPNGAGKTTTTEILEGYRKRTAGEVSVLGFDPGKADRRMRQRIGIVLQECGIQLELTVAETIEMYRSYYPNPRPVDEVIEVVQLDAKRTARIKTLSGGQRRRVDLALALVGDPDLIFLDEPTTGFDPSARRASWEAIKNLCSLGKTVFLTTHFMDEAQYLADRVAVVAGGEIVAEGTPATLGGRDVAAARISFVLPAGMAAADLPGLDAKEVTVTGDLVVIATEAPTATMHRLTSWAVGRSVELPKLTLSQPSLEDVYLELTEVGS